MSKDPVEARRVAQSRLGTTAIKDTVNAARRHAGEDRGDKVGAARDVLGGTGLIDRAEARR